MVGIFHGYVSHNQMVIHMGIIRWDNFNGLMNVNVRLTQCHQHKHISNKII